MNSVITGLITLILISVSANIANAQRLSGTWEGYFYNEQDRRDFDKKRAIRVEFSLRADSTYTVYSYTEFADFTAKCSVDYYFAGADSVYLKEIRLLTPRDNFRLCLQDMQLKLVKMAEDNRLVLIGRWETPDLSCGSGKIIFHKKD